MSAPLDRHARLFAAMPSPLAFYGPDLVLLEPNQAYLDLTGAAAADVCGRHLSDAYPPTPEALDEEGVSHLQRSFERALQTRAPDVIPVMTYPAPDPVTGEVRERYWTSVVFPLLDERGAVELLVQRVEEISDYVLAARGEGATAPGPGGEAPEVRAWRDRVAQVEADLVQRLQELQAARSAERAAARALAAQSDVAVQLAHVATVEELTEVVVRRGLSALGAQGGAVAVRDGDVVRLSMSELGTRAPVAYAEMRADDPLPSPVAATSGRRTFLADWQACSDYGHGMLEAARMTGCQAWAFLPLEVGGRPLGSLSVGYAEPQSFEPAAVELLDSFAAQCAQALARITARRAEAERAQQAVDMSEALQRSLLTAPVQVDHLQVAVRYRPAAHAAQVGGDWYDSFLQPGGDTVLVIGDVIGHDSTAAAAMGQVRGTLRAIGVHAGLGPAQLLAATDRAMHQLLLPTTATALVLRLEQDEAQRRAGTSLLRWSSAGHLPAVVLGPDGGVTSLAGAEADLLLGLWPDTERHDWTRVVPRGSTVLLCTDGLVERRGESLEEGLGRLTAALYRLGAAGTPTVDDPERLVDALLDELVPEHGEDDVALLAVRLHPQGAAA
ncbi:SpoIIE family protein phosphatase [Quadrisphaera sp. KR29]|uniref:SpoIIE family protein phosphatase n=1 Tax=Quadrisphaera sp. KR29 TaxID=3461391 RepID=UPI0040439FEF